jgi:hypothetical protein
MRVYLLYFNSDDGPQVVGVFGSRSGAEAERDSMVALYEDGESMYYIDDEHDLQQ